MSSYRATIHVDMRAFSITITQHLNTHLDVVVVSQEPTFDGSLYQWSIEYADTLPASDPVRDLNVTGVGNGCRLSRAADDSDVPGTFGPFLVVAERISTGDRNLFLADSSLTLKDPL